MLSQTDVDERLGVQNVGDVERVGRTLAGLAIAAAGTAAPRPARWPLRLVGLGVALSGVSGWCPVYRWSVSARSAGRATARTKRPARRGWHRWPRCRLHRRRSPRSPGHEPLDHFRFRSPGRRAPRRSLLGARAAPPAGPARHPHHGAGRCLGGGDSRGSSANRDGATASGRDFRGCARGRERHRAATGCGCRVGTATSRSSRTRIGSGASSPISTCTCSARASTPGSTTSSARIRSTSAALPASISRSGRPMPSASAWSATSTRGTGASIRCARSGQAASGRSSFPPRRSASATSSSCGRAAATCCSRSIHSARRSRCRR